MSNGNTQNEVTGLGKAVMRRRSFPRVTADAPSHTELLPLIAAASSTADHGSLQPWRLIELRGAARERLGDAMVAATTLEGTDAARLAAKPLRASLLLAIVVVHKPSAKVADWEQDAAAAGVAHTLSLLLDDAGWGVMWRTGPQVRSEPVRLFHQLGDNEELLGWLYVGGKTDNSKPERNERFDASAALTVLDPDPPQPGAPDRSATNLARE